MPRRYKLMDKEKNLELKKFWHELYIEMLSDPFDSRTDKAFCEENVLPKATLEAWKRRYRTEIFKEVNRRRAEYLGELRAQNLKEIAKNIKESFNDRQLLAKMTGDLKDQVDMRVEQLDHGDKVRRINELLNSIGKRKKAWSDAEASSTVEQGSKGDGPSGNGGAEPGKDTPDTGKV